MVCWHVILGRDCEIRLSQQTIECESKMPSLGVFPILVSGPRAVASSLHDSCGSCDPSEHHA